LIFEMFCEHASKAIVHLMEGTLKISGHAQYYLQQ